MGRVGRNFNLAKKRTHLRSFKDSFTNMLMDFFFFVAVKLFRLLYSVSEHGALMMILSGSLFFILGLL